MPSAGDSTHFKTMLRADDAIIQKIKMAISNGLPVNGGLWGGCVPVKGPGMSIHSLPCTLQIGGIIVGGGIWIPGGTKN
uniref:Uncharacterized protein n=1 Tax=Romanomermis culicivorax TaxID=13658 RepID=A0A915ISF3_ROMCU